MPDTPAPSAAPTCIEGRAAAIRIDNLDTDQIMPKQFLRGITKAGLDKGLLYDLRFDARGQARPDCVLNQPAWQGSRILVGGANFGCGSSREHAVWGLLQYGIQAVVAPSFGEIFHSNAMNNRLLLVTLPVAEVALLMDEADDADAAPLRISLDTLRLRSARLDTGFSLSARHHRMFTQGLDMIGMSLLLQAQTQAFAERHWAAQPWLKDVAARTRARLAG